MLDDVLVPDPGASDRRTLQRLSEPHLCHGHNTRHLHVTYTFLGSGRGTVAPHQKKLHLKPTFVSLARHQNERGDSSATGERDTLMSKPTTKGLTRHHLLRRGSNHHRLQIEQGDRGSAAQLATAPISPVIIDQDDHRRPLPSSSEENRA